MARLEREAEERSKQRQQEEHEQIKRRHVKERLDELRKTPQGSKILQNIDEEVNIKMRNHLNLILIKMHIINIQINTTVYLLYISYNTVHFGWPVKLNENCLKKYHMGTTF